MKKLFKKLREKFRSKDEDFFGGESEYVELDTDAIELREQESKIIIKQFTLNEFSDTKEIVDSLREGNVIALINIKPLKEKDLMEVKRSIAKIKKTIDAIDGDIAGFGEDYLIATPPFAKIERKKKSTEEQ